MSGTLRPGAPRRSEDRALRTRAELLSDLANAAWRRGEAAGDPAEARRWLERARRIAPEDQMACLSLALLCLRAGDAAQAADLFAAVTASFDVAEAWTGLAASTLRLGQPARAEAAMQALLSRHAVPPSAHALAAAVARAAGRPGWCALDAAGLLHAEGATALLLDGRAVPPGRGLRPAGRTLVASRDGAPLLGSPIDLEAIAAVEGFVAAEDGALVGWAWHPADPGRDPVLHVAGRRLVATETWPQAGERPLARPRRFRVAQADLPEGSLHVTAADGTDLLGSPIDPGAERRSAAGHDVGFAPVWADVVGPPPRDRQRRRTVDVVIPVYRGRAVTLACIGSVLASLPAGSRVHVVDDAGPDAALTADLDALARDGRILLIRHARNAGFPAAANAGIAAAGRRDVVLLNSDTLVPPGWLGVLADAAYSAPGIGSACPWSNEATILSYPRAAGGNPAPDLAGTIRLAALARQANGAATAEIPVGIGFCLYLRRDCLDVVGKLRSDLFAQGYGEENDWCLRARHRGWRHVAALGTFVAHVGAASFGAARSHLLARNTALLNRLHPGYDALIAGWIAIDPLGPARRRMDMRRWRRRRRPHGAILVSHGGGGGVDRVIAAREAALRASGLRPIVLRPAAATVVVDGEGTPNLAFALPAELDALVRLLRPERPTHVELHHMLGHAAPMLDLAARLGIPHEVHVHDYAWFCPRIALVPEHAYCGEPPVSACEACIADHGSNLEEDLPVAALVARSAGVFARALRVLTPSSDVAGRIRRHFPAARLEVAAWEDDAAIPPPPPTHRVRHVCVIGGIGVEKGFEVLLACVRDAANRRLALRFTVVGHTADDERLLVAGPVFVTGPYAAAEAEALIRAQRADIALIPSIWPETWCFTLGHAWRAGLRAAVFDIGTPAERVRRTGWGSVLPLGLAAPALNDWLLRQGRN